MMVERRCPTCICLAMLGLEKSTTTFSGVSTLGTPSRSRSTSASPRRAAIQASSRRRFTNPGPATSALAMASCSASSSATGWASSRGFFFSRLASGSTPLTW